MGEGDSPTDRDTQAVQTFGWPVDRPEYRALTRLTMQIAEPGATR